MTGVRRVATGTVGQILVGDDQIPLIVRLSMARLVTLMSRPAACARLRSMPAHGAGTHCPHRRQRRYCAPQ